MRGEHLLDEVRLELRISVEHGVADAGVAEDFRFILALRVDSLDVLVVGVLVQPLPEQHAELVVLVLDLFRPGEQLVPLLCFKLLDDDGGTLLELDRLLADDLRVVLRVLLKGLLDLHDAALLDDRRAHQHRAHRFLQLS